MNYYVVALLPAVAMAREGDQEVVIGLLDKAIAFFQDKGRDYAIKPLNALAGPFREGSLYAFAIHSRWPAAEDVCVPIL